MINQFIYKQLQKLEGSGALTLLWVGISSAIALTFFKVFEFIIRVILGVYQQARQLEYFLKNYHQFHLFRHYCYLPYFMLYRSL